MAAIVAALCLLAFFLGFRYYARFLGRRIYGDEEEIETPAHEFEDGVDFVPTNKHILFGHHFTSIAGAAPIIGPCIAAYWGWLPALIWVVLGTIFIGAMHDFGALVVSLRERGRSIADIAGNMLGGRIRLMFLSFVLVLIWLVLAVFAMVIADLFVSAPSTVLPVNIGTVIAVVIGWLIYKRKVRALVPSLVALVLLYLFVWVGTSYPLRFEDLGLTRLEAHDLWIVLLFAYAGTASLLPVWLLLQPRDYINSHQLFVGLGLLFAGLFVVHPSFNAPMLRSSSEGAPSIFPVMFVTIACGAVSGFHGLVSSGTTSKQVHRLRDSRFIGYGGMIGEGSLALASLMCAVAGIALVKFARLDQGAVQNLDWFVYYDSWHHAVANKAKAFVLGGGAFIHELGIPRNVSTTLMGVLVISFAATTLDTATRIQRFLIAELGGALKLRVLENRFVATLIAVIPAILLAMMKVPDPGTGKTKQAAFVLWPIFGASNQMLAALTLLVLALYFWQRKKPVLPIVLPMCFVTVVAILALGLNLVNFFQGGNWLLASIAALLLALILWMLIEGIDLLRKAKRADE